MKKKFLALVMTLSMVLSLVPMTALAAEEQPPAEPKQETQADVQVGQKEPTVSVAEEEGAEDKPMVQETPATSYAANGTAFTSDTGVKYKVTGTGEVEVTGCEDSVTKLVIPQTVFYEGVEYTVASIEEEAFDYYTFKKNNKNLQITSVDLSNASLVIGKRAFRGLSQLTEVVGMDNITEISEAAFNGCKVLEKVSKLSSLTSIDTQAFMNCSALTNLDGIDWSSLTHIGQEAFAAKSKSTSALELELTENTFKNLTSIGWGAFSGCSGVTGKVVFPESITEIPNSVFSGTGITDVDFSHITSIGNGAFKDCAGLTELKLSDSVTAIGDSAFSGTGISGELVLPDSITKIGSSAFYNVKITGSLVLPESLTTLGTRAFYKTEVSEVMIPGSLKIIGAYSFYQCPNLSNVVFAEGVETIGTAAFTGTQLSSLELPNSVETIEAGAFTTCANLTSVQIGVKGEGASKLKSIGRKAFNNDTSITYFYIEASKANVNIPDNTATNITIPSTVTVQYAITSDGENISTGRETTLQEDITSAKENEETC